MDMIHHCFEAQAKQFPACPAAIMDKHGITYDQLNRKANQLAHYLLAHGMTPGTPVAIYMHRSIELLVVILGILKAGGAYVPLDTSHPRDRLLFMLEDNLYPTLITTKHLKTKLAPCPGSFLCIDKDWDTIQSFPVHNPELQTTKNQLAYIIYTSGSTGMPKGVLIEHYTVLHYAEWLKTYGNLKPGQRIDFSSNYSFDMAISTSIVPLMLGLTVLIANDETKKNLRCYLQHLHQQHIHTIKLTPSYFKALLHEAAHHHLALTFLQNIILGGEQLPMSDCHAWLQRYPHHTLYNEYGPTETTVAVSVYILKHASSLPIDHPVPIGKPASHVEFYILDANQKPVSLGEAGELYIGGACLAQGYLNQPQRTQERFIQLDNIRLYKTGDICKKLQDGNIEYIGRNDQQIKWHGFRIEVAEIEQALMKYPNVKSAVVMIKENTLQEKQLVAYYLSDQEKSCSPKVLRTHLLRHLPLYMIPTAFIGMNTFPRTMNDKLDIAALPIPSTTPLDSYHAPKTKLEKAIAMLWSQELGYASIGRNDHFFELGGHSLMAARLIAKLEKLTGKTLPMHEFYASPTIAELANKIRRARKIECEPQPLSFKPSSHLPLADFQFMIWMSTLFAPQVKKLNLVGRKQFQGPVDHHALKQAFCSILKKQEILIYRTCTFRPAQYIRKSMPFPLIEINLRGMSHAEAEPILLHSLDKLINHHSWPKQKPWIIAKWFYLENETHELQIALPHIISDYTSLDIFFSDLSWFYLKYKDGKISTFPDTEKQFKDYVINEQYETCHDIEKNHVFWEGYLKEADLFYFPVAYVLPQMRGYSYSTYAALPETGLNRLHQFAAEHHISLTTGLSAVLWLALVRCCGGQSIPQYFFMNVIKSTRENPCYDDKMGSFLRVEPLKIRLSSDSTLKTLSQQIHQSTLDTMPYQSYPSLAKAACLKSMQPNRTTWTQSLLNASIYIYTKLFPTLGLNYTIFSKYGRLKRFKKNKDNAFVININVMSNFIEEKPKSTTNVFLNLCENITELTHHDLLNINYVFEACFLRDNHHHPYVVISSNLRPFFRQRIANEIIHILQNESEIKKRDEAEEERMTAPA